MIERDYLMRMIDVLIKSLSRVLLHKKEYEYPQAKREIEGAYRSLLGMSPEFVRSFSDVQLIELLGRDVESGGVKCYILGSLLKEEADIDLAMGEETKSLTAYTTSLSVLLTSFLDKSVPIEPGHLTKIDQCILALQNVDIPVHILEKLFAYYEKSGSYDKAENVLYDLVKSDREFVAKGLAFYDRLLNKSSDELNKGGLPRNEVLEGMHSLKEQG